MDLSVHVQINCPDSAEIVFSQHFNPTSSFCSPLNEKMQGLTLCSPAILARERE